MKTVQRRKDCQRCVIFVHLLWILSSLCVSEWLSWFFRVNCFCLLLNLSLSFSLILRWKKKKNREREEAVQKAREKREQLKKELQKESLKRSRSPSLDDEERPLTGGKRPKIAGHTSASRSRSRSSDSSSSSQPGGKSNNDSNNSSLGLPVIH